MGKIFAYIDGFNSYHCLKSAIDDKNTIKKLANNEILEPKYKDHKLVVKYAGFRECHIKPDLLLIYKKENNASSGQLPTLILVCIAIGSHSDLF